MSSAPDTISNYTFYLLLFTFHLFFPLSLKNPIFAPHERREIIKFY